MGDYYTETAVVGLVVFGLMYAGGMLWRQRKRLKQRGRVRDAARVPRATIDAATEGERVRVVGAIADSDTALVSPITQRRCVAFSTSIEAHTGEVVKPWAVVAEEHGAVDFAITDATGRALVTVGDGFAYDAAVFDGPVTMQLVGANEMMARHRGDRRAQPFAKHFRFREHVLPIGAEVAVVGTPVRDPADGAPQPRFPAPFVCAAPSALR